MSILKYLNRMQLMHWHIKTCSTGCCEEFANKMGISRRQLLENISELKSIGAPIKFGVVKNSYYYETDWSPFSVLNKNELNQLKGGSFLIECSIAALGYHTIGYQSINNLHRLVADTEKLIE